MGIFYKHHGLNYFGLGYQRGIVHAYNYACAIPFLGHIRNPWAPYHIY